MLPRRLRSLPHCWNLFHWLIVSATSWGAERMKKGNFSFFIVSYGERGQFCLFKGFIKQQNFSPYLRYLVVKLPYFVYHQQLVVGGVLHASQQASGEWWWSGSRRQTVKDHQPFLRHEHDRNLFHPSLQTLWIIPWWTIERTNKSFTTRSLFHFLVNIKLSREICLEGEILFFSFKINLFKNDSLSNTLRNQLYRNKYFFYF